jgi:hypothetical protein
MPALVAGIHVFTAWKQVDVDVRRSLLIAFLYLPQQPPLLSR